MALDKNLVCKECGSNFVFTASEQEFFAEKGFTNEPGRCPDCRRARKERNNGAGFGRNNNRQQREMHDVICASCGTQTQVPFRPSNDRPVYCRDCYNQTKRY